MENLELTVMNMYSDILNTYGDIGNFTCINQRIRWRGIGLNIQECTIDKDDDFNWEDIDIILIGGGSDNNQSIVSNHLLEQRKDLVEFVETGGVLLAICGSYQMFGNKYIDLEGNDIPCLEVFDIETKSEANRLIGDIVISNAIPDSKNSINNDFDFKLESMVGFENHGGRTYHNYDSLGYVKVGFGNNGEDKTEGMVYKNFLGSYLHGPFLPKNPHIADYMIFNALKRKYSIDEIEDLNDSIEINAHNRMLKRLLGE
jgi:CobQ-like glutamine amidotransferase family enzyme